jgi:hypothetical protein
MAQETNILIQVSDDGNTWTNLALLNPGTLSYTHTGIPSFSTKYYRVTAKGNGINTLDSLPSEVVSVTLGFHPRYQAVLDYATANSIGTPSEGQNIVNDNIIRNLVKIGVFHPTDSTQDKIDLLYYFRQESGTPYEFLTLNWQNPSAHRLVNQGSNPIDFVGGVGFKAAGGNNQIMSCSFVPSVDADKFGFSDSSMFFKTFDIPTTYAAASRVAGSSNDSSTRQILTIRSATSAFIFRSFDQIGSITVNQVNGHFHCASYAGKNGIITDVLQEGTVVTRGTLKSTADLKLFGSLINGTTTRTEAAIGLSYFGLGENLVAEEQHLKDIFDNTYVHSERFSLTENGTLRITTANTAGFPSLYYPKVYLSEPYKAYFSGITKDYIVLYSTNHSGGLSTPTPANGAIAWGECDTPDLVGYVDKGIIIAGYQSETPSMLINPNDPNGHHIWFFYHPDIDHPDSGGYQQTRLRTTSGGVNLHDATYTDRGKILGFTSGEFALSVPHTGYADAYLEDDGSVTVFHVTKAWTTDDLAGIPNVGISTCVGSNYTFTRVESDIDTSSFMDTGRMFHGGPSLFFERNGIQYLVGRNASIISSEINIKNYIAIYQADGNYQITSFLGNISSFIGGNDNYNAGYFIDQINDPDTLHIYYIKSGTQMFHTTWDLTNLD